MGLEAASDYGQALRMAPGLLPLEKNRRVILFGDGNDTHGNFLRAAQELTQQGFDLCIIPSLHPPEIDASIRQLEAPTQVELSRPFLLRGEVFATAPMDVTLLLEHNGAPNLGDSERKLHLEAGSHSVSFETVTRTPGTNHYRLSLTPQGKDAFTENNQASLSIDVRGRMKVLIVDSEPDAIRPFSQSLTAQQVEVDVHNDTSLPATLDELTAYNAVIISNLKAQTLEGKPTRILDEFVQNGGTLLVSGGGQGYGAGGWSGTRLESLLPVYATAPDEQERPELALVLAIDRSGSMTGLPLELAKSACLATVETLRPSDYIEVLAFDARPVRYVRMQPARLRSGILRDLSKIVSGGDTELFYALDMAYQDLVAVESRRKHVILLTDGQSPTTGLSEMVHAMVADNITLTTVGLGTGVDTDLLRHLAERGGGRYHAAPNPDSLPRIFLREAETVSASRETAASFQINVRKNVTFLRHVPVAEAPDLFGYHRVSPKPSPAEIILESDRKEPILARIRRGSGWVYAWTSDLHPRWANAWLRWPHMGQLFTQLLRESQSENHRPEIPMQVSLESNRLVVEFDTDFGDDARERVISLSIDGPNAASSITQLVDAVAPGKYRAEYTLPSLGSYQLNAEHRSIDRTGRVQIDGISQTRVSWSYPTEYASLKPNVALLEQVMTSTRSTPCNLSQFAKATPRSTAIYESKRTAILLMTLLGFLLDLTLKRLRFKPREPSPKELTRTSRFVIPTTGFEQHRSDGARRS
jgi:uncharacterized membrane protein